MTSRDAFEIWWKESGWSEEFRCIAESAWFGASNHVLDEFKDVLGERIVELER